MVSSWETPIYFLLIGKRERERKSIKIDAIPMHKIIVFSILKISLID